MWDVKPRCQDSYSWKRCTSIVVEVWSCETLVSRRQTKVTKWLHVTDVDHLSITNRNLNSTQDHGCILASLRSISFVLRFPLLLVVHPLPFWYTFIYAISQHCQSVSSDSGIVWATNRWRQVRCIFNRANLCAKQWHKVARTFVLHKTTKAVKLL